jgi:hypothetical protein
VQLHLARLDLGDVQHVVHHAQELLPGGVDLFEVVDELFHFAVLGFTVLHVLAIQRFISPTSQRDVSTAVHAFVALRPFSSSSSICRTSCEKETGLAW